MSSRTNIEAARQFVEFGLKMKAENQRESASGPGSSLESTKEVRNLILSSVREFSIRSILDLGCGDLNWMSHVIEEIQSPDFPSGSEISYEGWDVHPDLVRLLNETYGDANISFKVGDVTADDLPCVDLVICRDVLFHLDRALGKKVIERIRDSGAKFFLATSFPDINENDNIVKYNHIDGWGFYRINLDIEPFNLGSYCKVRVEETNCANKGFKRYACLYQFP